MGVLYYATNPETKQAYELGKGGWEALCPDEYGVIPTDGDLKERVLAELNGPWFHLDPDVIDVYADEISSALQALGRRLILESDSGDWYFDHVYNEGTKDYSIVGTRYHDA